MTYHFETTCISASGEDINAMTQAAKEVTYRTMLNRVGAAAFIPIQRQLGY